MVSETSFSVSMFALNFFLTISGLSNVHHQTQHTPRFGSRKPISMGTPLKRVRAVFPENWVTSLPAAA
jgi:hypothetical protein